MQQLSLTTTLIGLILFFSVALGHSLALARQGVFVFAASEKVHQNNQELHEKTSMIENSRSARMKQRIGIGDIVVEAKKTKEVEIEANSGANNVVAGINGHGGEKELSLNHELNNAREISPKVHFGGVVPFTSDYHLPKNHPPKNN